MPYRFQRCAGRRVRPNRRSRYPRTSPRYTRIASNMSVEVRSVKRSIHFSGPKLGTENRKGNWKTNRRPQKTWNFNAPTSGGPPPRCQPKTHREEAGLVPASSATVYRHPRCPATTQCTAIARKPGQARKGARHAGNLHPFGPDSARNPSHAARLRGVPQEWRPVGSPAPVPRMRSRRLLRLLPEPARHQALPSHPAPHHAILRTRETWGWCYIDEVPLDHLSTPAAWLGRIPVYLSQGA